MVPFGRNLGGLVKQLGEVSESTSRWALGAGMSVARGLKLRPMTAE